MANRTVAGSERDVGFERAFAENALDAINDVAFLLDGERMRWWNRRLEEATGYAAAEIATLDLEELVAPSRCDGVPGRSRTPADADRLANAGEPTLVFDLVAKDGDRTPHEFRTTAWVDEVTGETYRFGIGRDVSEWLERTRELERQRGGLETLARVDERLRAVTREMFEATTRNEVERVVCERLVASDPYGFAWIGVSGPGDRTTVVRTSAALDDEIGTLPTATTGPDPVGRALRTGELQVVRRTRDDSLFEPLRGNVPDPGVESVAVVPLVGGDGASAVLAVYASRPLAFGHRERAGLETLGEAVGFAIDAIENRRLLFADAVVELEFEVADTELVFVRASESLECELTVTGHVESPDGTRSAYLAVDGASPTDVRDLAAADPDVDRVRVVADEDVGGLLEFVTDGRVLNGLTEHGAVLTAGHVEDGQGRFSVEAHRATDVRRLVARLRDAYPDSTLVAQREFDRPVRRAVEVRQSLEDRLTDRQREALVRAYHAGYFDWPRGSTAGDVAASMDVAETTFHYHLRNALDELLAAFTGPGER